MVSESGCDTEAAAPSGSPKQSRSEAAEIEECSQQQKRISQGEEIEERALTVAKGDPPPSIAVGADGDMCKQELSPLSAPEGLGGSQAACERDRKKRCGPGDKKIDDAQGSSPGADAFPQNTQDPDKATPLATAVVRHQDTKQAEEEAQRKEGLAHDRMGVVALQGRGGISGGGSEGTTAPAEQQKARDQAKRLTLEVARLRSTLRATTSELNSERFTRVRIEDEWWKKMEKWEEERGSLIASKQEAERLSRSAEKESKAREDKAASEIVAREDAQRKADSVMTQVLKVQDRLVKALQAELTMTNRAREAAQDDARETKKQLRLYVHEFLLWRDRAKRLEARQAGNGASTPPQHSEGHGTVAEPVTAEASPAPTKGSAEHDGHAQTSTNHKRRDESIPQNYVRYFETDTGGYPAAPADAALLGLQGAGGDPKKGQRATETEAAAAAPWSTRLAMTGPSLASSREHFERSMKAQQAASARLEKDLVKARADLKSIFAGSRTSDVGGGGGGGKTVVSAGLRPGMEEGRPGVALSEGARDVVGGDGREGGNDNQHSPESPTNQESRNRGDAHSKGKAGESVAYHVAKGSHLSRVLVALLGGDPAAAATVPGKASDVPPPSLRLTDFPPVLQAVFGEELAPSSPAAAFEDRVASSKGGHGRFGESGLRQLKRRWAKESTAVETLKGGFGLAGNASASENGRVYSATTLTSQVGVDGCGRRESPREEGLHPAAGESTAVSGVAEGQEKCSLTGAFQGYQAKSSLLQRWLDERVSPPLSQSGP
eukprot:g8410.t1